MNDADVMRPLIRLYEEVINQGNLDVIDEIYDMSGAYLNHAAPFGLAQDVVGLRKLMAEFVIAFPDQHIVADEMFVSGDRVIARWTITGTHRGTFFGVAPTGRTMRMTGIDIERVVDGRIAEHWGAEDMLSLLESIGAVTVPSAA